MRSVTAAGEETQDCLTDTIVDKLNNPSTSPDFDFQQGVNRVLADVGMSAEDNGGKLTFYGQDPIIPSRIRFATTAGSSEEHTNVLPDVFTAETPLGTYQGLDEQVYLSKSPGSYRTVIVLRGSNKPAWLS